MHGMAAGDLGEDIGEIGFAVEIVHFGGLDERGVDGPMASALVGVACEEVFRGGPSAMRMARSTTLLSISMRPSSR